jgi:hypothetical protein
VKSSSPASDVAVAVTSFTCLVEAGIRMVTWSDNGPDSTRLGAEPACTASVHSCFMFRRRKAERSADAALRDALAILRRTATLVEEAKRGLVAAAPAGRSAGIPLAEALAAFEQGLDEAAASMSPWRRPEVIEAWDACMMGLEEAGRRAERLRLGDPPEGYEQLYGELEDLMEPLDAFAGAFERFRKLGV